MANSTKLMFAALIVLGLIAPAFVYPVLAMKVLCFALFACAFNLLLGYAGLLSFGHAAFLGTAAYVLGYVTNHLGLPTELGIISGVLASTVLGYVFGSLAIRRSGIYFAMITLALAQLAYFVYLQAPFTGGEDGLQDIPRGTLLGIVDLSDDLNLYYFVLVVFLAGFWLVHRAVHSPFGEVLAAIRENEARAISLGYDVEKHKLMAFVLSAALSGLAGATKALVFRFATLTDVHWQMSGEVILMTLMGGMGTIFGPVVGATTIVMLQNFLADKAGSYTLGIFGVIFILCVLFFRRGIVGELVRFWARSNARSADPDTTNAPATRLPKMPPAE